MYSGMKCKIMGTKSVRWLETIKNNDLRTLMKGDEVVDRSEKVADLDLFIFAFNEPHLFIF